MENRRPWTPEEIALLDERYAAGVLVKIIAGEMGRSVDSVEGRLARAVKRRDRRRYERRERFFVTMALSPGSADIIRQRSADLGQAYGRIIAAIIEGALDGEADGLRAALKPFAEEADNWDDVDDPDSRKIDDLGVATITLGHCRAARRALTPKEKPE